MPLHVDPRKHELLEARIQGTNSLKNTNNTSVSLKNDNFSNYVFHNEEPSITPEHLGLRGSSSPFSSAGDHDRSTSSSDLAKPVSSSVFVSVKDSIDQQQVLTVNLSKTFQNLNQMNVSDVNNFTHNYQISSFVNNLNVSDYCVSPIPKRQRASSNSVMECDVGITNTSQDDTVVSPTKVFDSILVTPTSQLNSVQQCTSRSNSIQIPVSCINATSSPNKPCSFNPIINEKLNNLCTFQNSLQPIPNEANVSPSSTKSVQDSLTPRTYTKKRRKIFTSEDVQNQKSRKFGCQDRGSKRIDEIFRVSIFFANF